jgi:hypothetical protein
MELEYKFPGTIKISLDNADLSAVRSRGSCMDRNGFAGIENKTWIHADLRNRYATATIDGDGDLTVNVPRDQASPCTVERERITADNESSVQHYLGETGVVIVEWKS